MAPLDHRQRWVYQREPNLKPWDLTSRGFLFVILDTKDLWDTRREKQPGR
jgi:hypothetical protein